MCRLAQGQGDFSNLLIAEKTKATTIVFRVKGQGDFVRRLMMGITGAT